MTYSDRQLANELDRIAAQVRDAFQRRDLDGVMCIYSSDLEYTQPNGVTIDRDKLARDIATQLNQVDSFRLSGIRESLKLAGDCAIEVSTQEITYTTRAFWFLSRTWNLSRRSKRWWKQTDEGWRIRKVIVLEERQI
jgi:ketosteroid isomerase-like protein